VGFFGWGGGVGINVGLGFGFGHVGWVPLAPFESFRPWYGRGIGGAGVVNNFNVVNSFRNARFVNGVNGVTSMRTNEFGRAGVNTGNFVRASAVDLRSAGSIQGRMPVTPGAQSMRFSDRAVNTAGMPASNRAQRFAGRTGFSRPGATASAARVTTAPGAANSGGWTRMTPRASSTGAGASTAASRGASSSGAGWRSFNPRSSGAGSGGTAARSGYPSSRGGYAGGNTGANGRYAPQTRSATPQQAVRISPPIVSNRGASGGGSTARPDVHSGFGGAHSSGGGSRGGGNGGSHRGR
jgi:hypothetical protein